MKLEFNSSNVTINFSQKEFSKLEPLVFGVAEDVNILSLTDEELYILRLLTDHIEMGNATVASLYRKLDKLDGRNYNEEDYDKVVFKQDPCGDTVIQILEENE